MAAIAQRHCVEVLPAVFGKLGKAIRRLPTTDLALEEVVQGFADFVFTQCSVPREEEFAAARLTGTAWPDNFAHGVRHEPVERSPKYRRAAFLGAMTSGLVM